VRRAGVHNTYLVWDYYTTRTYYYNLKVYKYVDLIWFLKLNCTHYTMNIIIQFIFNIDYGNMEPYYSLYTMYSNIRFYQLLFNLDIWHLFLVYSKNLILSSFYITSHHSPIVNICYQQTILRTSIFTTIFIIHYQYYIFILFLLI